MLKFTNAEYDRDAVRRLHEESAGLNVVLLDGYMDRAEIWALINAADGYLSPHRSEGFGLTILESMRLGKPVIATAYSGNMDFMTPENSFPLSYRLVTLERDYGPYMRGASWADPDLDEAARLLRVIVDHPEAARARGERAQQQVSQERHPAVTGAVLRERLIEIRNAVKFETPVRSETPVDDPKDPHPVEDPPAPPSPPLDDPSDPPPVARPT